MNTNPPLMEKTTITKDALRLVVEVMLKDRMKANGIKPESAAARKMESDYLCGAMAAIHAIFPDPDANTLSSWCPPGWVLLPMSGRPVIKKEAA